MPIDAARRSSLRPKRKRVFLDCAASAPLDPAVAETVVQVARQRSANPSSVHRPGLRAMREVELARMRVAGRLGGDPDALVFTSGGTEANNLAIKGAVWAAPRDRKHVLVSSIEHPCVLEAADWLQHTGQAEVERIPVDRLGRVLPATLERMLRPDTLIVSVMHANNEVGTVQDLVSLGELSHRVGALFHTDACQSFCKVPLDVGSMPVDLVTINAHKVHGPKGVGALYVRPGVAIAPLQHGGGHEGGLRSGTLNVPGIAGFGAAVEAFAAEDGPRMTAMMVQLVEEVRGQHPNLRVNGMGPTGVGNILNISIPGRSGKVLFMSLDRVGIAVSSSSACHSTKLTPSHVLLAMGYTETEADEGLRVSCGRFTTTDEVTLFRDALFELLRRPPEDSP